jgi:hypothetical protein
MGKKIDLAHLSEDENAALKEFTKYYEEGNLTAALDKAKSALDQFPDSQPIWDNQVGALTFQVHNDYVGAFKHYEASYKGGFDQEVCEDNLWEAAEYHYKSLQDGEGGFNALLFEDGTFISANELVSKYKVLFPQGKYYAEAEKLSRTYAKTT